MGLAMRISLNIRPQVSARRLLPPIILMLTVTACSVLPERPPSPALHDFGSGENVTAAQDGLWSTVAVDAPEWLQSESIRYRLMYADPTHVRFYSLDRWVAPPSSLLAQRLSLASGDGGWKLKIRLLEFEQVFDNPENARVIMAFRAVAYRPGSMEAAGEKVFRFSRPTPSPDAKGAVTAYAALIGNVAKELSLWLAGLGRGRN